MDSTLQAKSLTNSKKRKITIENDYLKRIQQRFAFATILLLILIYRKKKNRNVSTE